MHEPTSRHSIKRGPRGDIDRHVILEAADRLLRKRGTIDGISLRALAAEVGVAANALYTYFPSLSRVWHDLGDERLGTLHPEDLLAVNCRSCALVSLTQRAQEMAMIPGTLSLLRTQPILGVHSFRLSETLLTLTANASVNPRDAHDLLLAWSYGSMALAEEGWTRSTDEIRAQQQLPEFPLVAARSDPDQGAQLHAILRGIGIEHTCE
ncbi:MAG: helix-turn-helix domain-containing protein [Gulosibacter sp.]|uniref:helix-turn-helix domain-containing protein n=1 Tax=Gulosibacter sp. TaxID=2817531 RepID=UPI003F8E6F71